MARIPDAFIDTLLARTDIVEVIGARVQLKKQGREYSARCPFHDERSPSFTVSPTKQFYHCFGCGAHGTAIGFVMDYDRLEFLDAVEELARAAGLEVPRDTTQRNANPDIQPLYAALEAASQFFRRQLQAHSGAREYLQRRGVDEKVQQAFEIGYAPEGFHALSQALGTDERRQALLEKAGLFSRGERGLYDKFRHRVMFPIHDRRGRVIAFGGRVLGADDSPKYLNSPETPLFHKGRELYGLWQARQSNRQLARLVVVEGYMDVIALVQHGVTQAVATLGTATTPEHAELLFRSAPEVYFCFDGDRAGRAAAWKALDATLPRMTDGRQAFFLFLPEGEDPDSLVRAEGQAGFEARLENATPLSEVYFAERLQGISLTSVSGKAALADRCREDVRRVPDGGFRDALRARLRELTGIDVLNATPAPSKRAAQAAPRRSLVRSAITLLLQDPRLAADVAQPTGFELLRQPGVGLLLELLETLHARPALTTGGVLDAFAEHEDAAALAHLATQQLPGEPDALRAEFEDALDQLRRQAIQQEIDDLQARIREVGMSALPAQDKERLLSLQARTRSLGR